jgi:tetratricopeptide (TPR) repeat protein
MLGLLALRRADTAEAARLLRDAIRHAPDHAGAQYDLGNLLKADGQLEQAADCYRCALRARPDYVEAHNNLGNVLKDLKQYARAEACFRRALRIAETVPELHNNLGLSLARQNKQTEAEASFRTALQLRPDFVEAMENLALTLRDQDVGDSKQAGDSKDQARAAARQARLLQAEHLLRNALRLRPDAAALHKHLGTVLRDLGQKQDAVPCFHEALRLDPACLETHFNLGNVLRDLGELEEALRWFQAGVALSPDFPEGHNDLANALRDLARFEEAEAHYREAIRLRPDFAGAHEHLGNVLRDLGRLAEAEANAREACRLDPAKSSARFNLGVTLLLGGQYEEGWRAFEARFATFNFLRTLDRPRWNGEPLNGRTLLLHAEQGFGDTIQMCRYLPGVAALGGRVILEVPGPLLPLLADLPGVEQTVRNGDTLPPFDLQCPLMSLPHVLTGIPAKVPYLAADPSRVASWRARVAPLPGLRVGLAWAGNAAYPNDRRRSTTLSKLTRLADIGGVSFVSLQKGEAAAQCAGWPARIPLHDWTDSLQDFADTAALVEALDLVIGVDTAIVHLAGALGRPVWLMNRYDTCWRWLLGREDSPWYPTLRQFRQRSSGDWDSVVDQLFPELQAQALDHSPGSLHATI